MDNSANKTSSMEERRLWIGNLDSRVTDKRKSKSKSSVYKPTTRYEFVFYWYHLLKLVQKHGTIEKFDLIFHRNGPLAGQPRGYAFVTYAKKEDAVVAKDALNSTLVGQKNIVVTWAHSVNNEEIERPKPEINIPALAMSKEGKKTDRVSQIQAIEAKLKMMEKKQEDELKINDTVATKPPVIVQYQYNKVQTSNGNNFKHKQPLKKGDRYHKPYSKNKYRK